MVSCLQCMKELPYNCTCSISKKEKWKKYTEQLSRELKLIEAIMNGFRPKIVIQLEKVLETQKNKEVEILVFDSKVIEKDHFEFFVKVEDIRIDYDATMTIILSDVDEKPLYRRKVFIHGGCAIDVTWHLGVCRGGPIEEHLKEDHC